MLRYLFNDIGAKLLHWKLINMREKLFNQIILKKGIPQIQDILHNVISKGVLHQIQGILDNFIH